MGKITNQSELFNRVLPALRTKKNELIRNDIKIINENDIWSFNKIKWKNTSGLTISKMVDDILNTSDSDYVNYKIKKINEMNEQGE